MFGFKSKYPRVVEFTNGKFAVEVNFGFFSDKNSVSKWSAPQNINLYGSFETLEEATEVHDRIKRNINLNKKPKIKRVYK